MTKLQELLSFMEEHLADARADVLKFEEGNMSAGTRVRKAMQATKEIAQNIRLTVQEIKNEA